MPNTLKEIRTNLNDLSKVTERRMQVETENLANSKSVGYVPKGISFKAKVNHTQGTQRVEVAAVTAQTQRVKSVYDPTHPMADASGMVSLPDVNELTLMANVMEARHQSERALKLQEMVSKLEMSYINALKGR